MAEATKEQKSAAMFELCELREQIEDLCTRMTVNPEGSEGSIWGIVHRLSVAMKAPIAVFDVDLL